MGDLSPHFSKREFACKCGCGFDTPRSELLDLLEQLRKAFDRPIRVTSGCRCEAHNAEVGGSDRSQHVKGKAADIAIRGMGDLEGRMVIAEIADALGAGGLKVYPSWVHIDVREGPKWRG